MAERVYFEHPPVVETVLGVQFHRLPGLTNAHLGAFWQSIMPDWPVVNDAPALDEQSEAFGKKASWSRGVQLKLTQDAGARIQAKSKDEDRMVQLQNCRLDYNWLGTSGQEYPQYDSVRPEFDTMLRRFEAFIAGLDIGPLKPSQWEVTYVNHMLRNTVWHDLADWASVFKGLHGMAVVPKGIGLESLGGHWRYEIEPQRGRLHVHLQHGHINSPEGPEAFIMKLTARGPLSISEDPEPAGVGTAIGEGLDLGHDVIVRSFRDLTSEKAHEYWNRQP